MRVTLILLLGVLISCSSYTYTPPTPLVGVMKDVGAFSEERAQTVEKSQNIPVFRITNRMYVPDPGCVDFNKLRGDAEQRTLGGDSEGRDLGGDSEGREIGGDSEGRTLGGASEGRELGGSSEGRELGGDSEGRTLGGDSEGRNLGGDSQNRNLGGDTAIIKCQKLPDNSGFQLINVNPNANITYYFRGRSRTLTTNVYKY